ncbi:MAG: 16S rRNA (guanine(966)-N(2))-methyltransferase RsmD [Candidatus Makaraimicrobium thalassicum]|nr:MAG: 16S rRNA (guanine(966)-N(2))-methyltransferase RsmD [Candidatus Omnitrophota bacterium]
MRIIGGKYRGRRIKQPGFAAVRPTKDRIREAVFNIIAAKVPGAGVLDIFAGSGAYGLEALSRGAEKALFVEKNRRCGRAIGENIRLLGAEERARIITGDVFKSMELLAKSGQSFDLAFSDPPYNRGMAKKTLIIINHYDILKPAGLLIIEHHRAEDIPEVEGNVSIFKQKTYKNIFISVFLKK